MGTLKVTLETEHRALIAQEKSEELAREEAKKNHNFYQINKTYFNEVMELAAREKAAGKVLTTLVNLMNYQNAVCCTLQTLAEQSKVSLATVKRALPLLQKERWIEIVKIGKQNVFKINSLVFWQTTATGKYAVFHATIIANQKDQEKTQQTKAPLRKVPLIYKDEIATLTGEDGQQRMLDV